MTIRSKKSRSWGVFICMALCNCGYKVEIINFRNYGGTKDLQMKWEKHIGTWKGWGLESELKTVT